MTKDWIPIAQAPVRDLVELRSALAGESIPAELIRPPGSSGNG